MGIQEPRKLTDATADQGGRIQHKQSFYFAVAAAAGDLCVIDEAITTYGLGSAAKISPATADLPTILGVAEDAIAAGTWGELVTYGVVTVKGAADLDALDPVCSAATAGTVREFVEGTDGNRVGFALEADGAVTAGYARIFVQLGG